MTGPAEEADGVTTAWITFETATGRCSGLLRLTGDQGAWTLLTTLDELKGYEEPLSKRRRWHASSRSAPST